MEQPGDDNEGPEGDDDDMAEQSYDPEEPSAS